MTDQRIWMLIYDRQDQKLIHNQIHTTEDEAEDCYVRIMMKQTDVTRFDAKLIMEGNVTVMGELTLEMKYREIQDLFHHRNNDSTIWQYIQNHFEDE